MIYARKETIETLFQESMKMPVVDSHTHIQDDLPDFNREIASANLVGTQASFNCYPETVIEEALKNKLLVRRLMTDPLHGLLYSWFAEIAEGAGANLDSIIESIGDNREALRKNAARNLCAALKKSRFSEYAQWLRIMFSFYLDSDSSVCDILAPENIDALYTAVAAKRNLPDFASKILHDNNICSYVTSLENRCALPFDSNGITPDSLDLSHAFHPEAYNMFDAHYLVWPEGATDFGYFLGGHKYESEKYLLHLEQMLGVMIDSPESLSKAVKDFLKKLLWSPKSNPESRIRYVNIFMPVTLKLNDAFDITEVKTAIHFHKGSLHGNSLKQVVAFVSLAMLDALDEIGEEMLAHGEEYGSCLQIAMGVSYFMDPSREIQSFPVYKPGMPQEAYSMWSAYPHIHFEYILAHELLYQDFSNAAKQVGNISVGPWWHLFRKQHIAEMLYDQLTMGPVTSIASGFTDARFVEMLAAKYRSVRYGVSMALAEMVDDPFSSMHGKTDSAIAVMREILFLNPTKIHHLPILRQK